MADNEFTPPPSGGLGDKLLNALGSAFERAGRSVVGLAGNMLRDGLLLVLNAIARVVVNNLSPLVTLLVDNESTPSNIKAELIKARDTADFGSMMFLVTTALGMAFAMMGGATGPHGRSMAYSADKLIRSARLTPSEALLAYHLNRLKPGELFTALAELGYSDKLIGVLDEISYVPPGLADMRDAVLRKDQSPEWAVGNMVRMGMTQANARQVIANWQLIPGPSDLIRMAVREAFSPEQVAALGLDADLPGEFVEWAAKQGLSAYWARNFWRAHWDLPSPTQAYQMLHRRLISPDELDALLRAADYAPVWRDKLAGISYHTFTRVDIRRMYDTGTLTPDDVMRAYLDAGYNEWSASKLTDWTIRDKSLGNKELVKSELLSAYSKGLLSKADTAANLANMGYDQWETGLLIDIADYQTERQEHDQQLELVHQQYIDGLLTDTELTQRLAQLQLSATAQERYLRQWRRARVLKPKRPSIEQLQEWARKKLVDEQTFRYELDSAGWGAGYVDLFWQEVSPERSPAQLMTQYRERAIDQAEFTDEMGKLGYSPAQIQDWIETLAPELSLADLKTLRRKELINVGEFRQELSERGFSAAQVAQLEALSAPQAPTAKAKAPKRLTLAQMQLLVAERKMTLVQYLAELREAGYNVEDSERLIEIMRIKLASQGVAI